MALIVINFVSKTQTRVSSTVFAYNGVPQVAPNQGTRHDVARDAAALKRMHRETHCDRPRYLEDPADP